MNKVSSVEEYIERNQKFADALSLLRSIMNNTELEETLKWSAPVYTLNGKNVLSLGGFKNHFGIWFFNGVFLKDEAKVLENAQEKTKGMRHMKFTSVEDIDKNLVRSYVLEAIENQKMGKVVKASKTKTSTIDITDPLKTALDHNTELNKAFKDLSPYKQKEYAEHISSAKRDATRQSRLEKIIPMIKNGIGLNDKYKNC